MPNHITNILKFSGNQDNIDSLFKIIERVNDDKTVSPIDFKKIIPIPDHIFTGDLGEKERKKYGEYNWYDWSLKNWGTKWNAYDQKRVKNDITFDTAWSSPTQVFDGLVELIRKNKFDVSFHVIFADENTSFNTGYYNYTNDSINAGYYEDESNDAFQAYIECKGESYCIFVDENGDWNRYKCDDACPNRDIC